MDAATLLDIACKALLLLLPIFFSALVGYFFGAAKAFREQKVKAHEEILPPIIKAAFEPEQSDQPDFNRALLKLWLFASKKVALKMDHALSVLVHPQKGDRAKALQEAIVEMRADIQFLGRQRLKPEDVSHFYTKFGK